MAELSKIMIDDENNYYVVPLTEEKTFNDMMARDSEDWIPEEFLLAETWLIDGDYENVQFMWPVAS